MQFLRGLTVLFLAIALVGCSANSHVTTQKVIADISVTLDGLSRAVPALAAQKPPTISPALANEAMERIAQAQTLVANVGPGTPAADAGTTLLRAEAYLNAVLATLAGLPLPPPYGMIVTAAIVLEPIIAAELQAFISNQEAAPREGVTLGMTPNQARATLKATH